MEMTTDNISDDTENNTTDEQSIVENATYTVALNRKRYALNESARESVERQAELEYEENEEFSCWWKVASKEQYSDEQWEQNVHQEGDPILVIETRGIMTPWDDMDTLDVEMENAESFGGMGDDGADVIDSGNGMKSFDPNSMSGDDAEKVIGRTHFEHTPRSYEEVPSPDGEEKDKIPPKPIEMGDEPLLVSWVPNHPDITHTWSAGEGIIPTHSWVEWNVQARANQPRIPEDKQDSHDHWEALLNHHECPVVSEMSLSQEPGGEAESTVEESTDTVTDMGGRANGNNWTV